GGIPFPGRVRPSLGSLVSYLDRGTRRDWPAFTVIGRRCNVSGADLRGQTSGALGSAHYPFYLQGYDFDPGGPLPASLEAVGEIGGTRLDQRQALLGEFDGWQQHMEVTQALDRFGELHQKAFGLLTSSGAKRALNLDEENDQLRDRY